VRFPVPVQDIRCSVDAAVDRLRRHGLRADPVVLLGHSSGAHLSSLAAFGDRAFRAPGCPYPPSRIDGWVGLSGIYDLRLVGSWSWEMMGATQEEDPAGYARAATETYLSDHGRPTLRTLVVHGEADELIPPFVADDFADLLREHGYRTRLTLIPGADHNAVYQAPVVADVVLDWLRTVRPGAAAPQAPAVVPAPRVVPVPSAR
jgi:acetyl esterase/lipase